MAENCAAELPANPIDRLAWIESLLRATGGVHEGVAAASQAHADWLCAALLSHVHDGVSLDQALGLSLQKGRQPRFYVLLRERNRYLRLALDAHGGDVHALLDEVGRYESRVSAAQRNRSQPDPLWSSARQWVHLAARLNVEIPRTPEGMRKALCIKAGSN